MDNKKRTKATSMAYIFGGLSIAGALITFLSGFFFGILGLIASLIAIKKDKESIKVIFTSIIGISLSTIVLILFLTIGPIEHLV